MFKINKKGQKVLNKSFAFLSIVSLVLQSLSGIFFLTPSYAQEDPSVPTPIPTIEAAIITSAPEAGSTQAPIETVTPTPVIEVPTSTPTPTTEPIVTPTPIATEPPVLTITPTVAPEETQPKVLAASLPQEQSPPPASDLLPSGTDQTSAQLNPSISTDKNDYTPNETAIISGKDLKPNTEYKIVITADKFLFEDKFITTDKGTFIYSFPLGGIYRPDYKVEINEGETVVASTTFTDEEIAVPQVVINEIYPNPSGGGSETAEFIELYNRSAAQIDISGWWLDDIESIGSSPFQIPAGTLINAGGFLAFQKGGAGGTGIALNNDGDTARLLNSELVLVDSYSYITTTESKSYDRCPNGGDTWVELLNPTQGGANDCFANICSNLNGAIWTTDSSCGSVNLNDYASKGDVYLNGGPQGNGGSGLPDGNYYAQVTEPDGTLLGKSTNPDVVVASGSFQQCYNLYALTGFSDTTNPGGNYKVWLSPDSNFPESCSKTDNFKVENTPSPSPTPIIIEPYCGDGNLDLDQGEECDDGNNEDGDGCSSDCVIEVPECTEGAGWATEVISSKQGTLKSGGTIIDPARTDLAKTLGVNDGVFFSLGYGGTIVLSFEQWVTNAEGNDLSFHEVTWGRTTYPVEKAEVFVSQDNSTWQSLGEITNKDNGLLGISYKDISVTGWDWIKYVKLVDTTNDPAHDNVTADGFDLDAIDVVYGVCEEPQPEPFCGDGEINQEREEQCDKGIENGQVCTPEYGSSCNYCSDSCQEVTVSGPYCGDNVKNGNEQCDGINDCLVDCTLKPVVAIDPVPVRIIDGQACGVGNAWDDDGLKVDVTNWKAGYKLLGRYFIAGGSFVSWFNLSTLGPIDVIGTNASFFTPNSGNSPAGPAGWEVKVVDTLNNDLSNTDSLNYTINSDASSEACGGVELWWYKVESYKDTNESASPLAASGTWTAMVRDSAGALVGTVLNTNASTVDTFNKSVTYNNIKLPYGVYTLSEDVNPGYQFSWGRCMDSTDAVPYNSSFYFDVGSAEGKQQVFGPDVAGLTSDGSPWSTSTDEFAQLNLTAGKRIYCVFYNKQLTQISGMKFDDANGDGVKDEGESGLSDWTIFAGQKVWESDVQALNTPEVTSSVLSSGTAYAIRVSNTYNAGDGITADAKYSKRAPNTGWTDYVQHYEGYGPSLLDLQIDGTSPNWGAYNTNHIYWQMVTGSGAALKFQISDFYPSNDTGSLHVEIYKVIAQTSTDGSGNYSFSLPDVSGNVIIGEVTQNGYTQTAPMPDGYWTITQGSNATGKDFGNAPATTYGRVTFEKVVSQGDASPNSWSFTIDGVNGSFTTGQDAIIPVGTYTVGESSENDSIYRSVSVAGLCRDLNIENRQATLMVTEDGGTCTFTNTINTGSITVDKVTDPSGDPQSFDFSFNKDGQTFDNFSLTDSATPYSNTALLSGTYSLEEFVPDGWMNNSWSCWQNDNPVSNNTEIVIGAGDQVSCVFNNTKLGSIWGRKFRDTNANGERDGSSDPYLNDWTINLYDDGWGWVKGMLTGDDFTEVGEVGKGQYKFINLLPGNYYVCEELESGWMQTKPSELEGSVYEDGDGNSFCYAVELAAGGTEKGLTFGNFKLGKVQGMKYEDADGDGLPHENGEGFLNDWTIRLYKSWEDPVSVVTSNTGETGQYRYTDLLPGTYQVCEVLKEGWTQTWPKVGNVPVADNGTLRPGYGQAVTNESGAENEGGVCWQTIIDSSGDFNQLLRFGNTQFGSISGYKYEDVNGNGTRGEGELGLNKWTIFLDGDDDGVLGTEETSLITDDSGYYRFENLIAGDYQVCETPQEGWQRTQPADSDCQTVVVNPGQETPDIGFGNFKLGEINGWKWDDYNGNGFWDEGEPALSGWEICLSLSEESTFRFAEQDNGNCVQTDDNGYFEFTGLRAGNYRLTETAQPGWNQTWPVDPNYYDLTIRSGTYYGGEICNGQPRVNGIVAEEIRQLFCTNFGNELQPITLTLSKTNNIFPGSMGPGGTVIYTLIVTNTSKIIAQDVSVRDTLPIGFSYVASSTTGASEPTVTGQNIVWSLGNLDPDAVVTITYQAKTDSSLQEGKYPNVALAWGNNRVLDAADNYKTYTDPAWSWVNVIPSVGFSAGIGGIIQQVLGVSTEEGEVLGAATGSETYWLIMAIIMMAGGLFLVNRKRFIK